MDRLAARRWLWWATSVVLVLGLVEGWYGQTDSGDVYGSDGVQYLDCARAMERGDWHSALNALWSQGYPAVVAVVRPLFAKGAWGDWLDTRVVNFACFGFTWGCFCFLLGEVGGWSRWRLGAAVGLFVGMQVCLDQVSRVGPDQLLAGFLFLVCGLVLRLRRGGGYGVAVGLGVALGVGFVVKAVFLVLGVVVLGVAMAAVRRRVMVAAVVVFGVIVGGYGVVLSRAVGRATLGDSGSLNYAWHVDRLQKWVHWEGGVETAEQAWPKPWIGRFVKWDAVPPDFGVPVHPSVRVGRVPTVYVFEEPVVATYVPYYDPAYWYLGYKHVVRWRYQVVALGKNLGDLAGVVKGSAVLWGLVVAAAFGWRGLRRVWPVVVIAVLGILLYLPVHLEGRYLSGYFAVLGVGLLAGVERRWVARVVIGLAVVGLVWSQSGVWGRVVHGWSPRENVEWRAGDGVRAMGLEGAQVGSVSWTPALHCDWAYMAGVRIVAEIASPGDEKAFWGMDEGGRLEVLGRFRGAGASAVMSWDRPPDGASGWVEVPGTGMWVSRF